MGPGLGAQAVVVYVCIHVTLDAMRDINSQCGGGTNQLSNPDICGKGCDVKCTIEV